MFLNPNDLFYVYSERELGTIDNFRDAWFWTIDFRDAWV